MTNHDENLLKALRARRSVPVSQLRAPGPDDNQLMAMLEIAGRVPDHGRLEPWRFIVMRGDWRIRAGEMIADLAQKQGRISTEAERDKELTRFSRAPLVVIVVATEPMEHPRIPAWEQLLSAGACAFNLLYAAMAHGYGASWVTNWFSDDAEGRRILGVGPKERIAGIVHIGTFDAAVPERPRPDMAAKVSDYAGPWEGR